jgi:hypothetical protein
LAIKSLKLIYVTNRSFLRDGDRIKSPSVSSFTEQLFFVNSTVSDKSLSEQDEETTTRSLPLPWTQSSLAMIGHIEREMRMANERDQFRAQPGQGGQHNQPQHGQGQPGQSQQHQDKSRMGDKPQQGTRNLDQGKVGQDTDGDGKVVKPGQTPGQSHGTGQIKK